MQMLAARTVAESLPQNPGKRQRRVLARRPRCKHRGCAPQSQHRLVPGRSRHARILWRHKERAMLRTGKEHLESLRDGRVVYIGSERVDDVTRHPAFCNAAATVAALYDMKADPANREAMSYEEDGARHSVYFLRPRTRADLQRRMEGHRRI